MNPPDDLDIVYLPDMEGFADPDSLGNGEDEGPELDEQTLAYVKKIERERDANRTGGMGGQGCGNL
jgi:hypothetical protein